MVVESEITIHSDTQQFNLILYGYGCSRYVDTGYVGHGSAALSGAKQDGFGFIWVECQTVMGEPGTQVREARFQVTDANILVWF